MRLKKKCNHLQFDQITPFPSISFLVLQPCNWPDLFDAAWQATAPHVESAEYEARKQTLIDSACHQVRAWKSVSTQMALTAMAEISAIFSAFQIKFIPEMLLDVTLIKRFLDGRQAALASRFSAV